MPQILITKTLGPHVVEGTIKKWSQAVIDSITAQTGERDWYVADTCNATRRFMADTGANAQKRKVS